MTCIRFKDEEVLTVMSFSEACAEKNKTLRKAIKQVDSDITTLVDELNSLSDVFEQLTDPNLQATIKNVLQERTERLTDLRYKKAQMKSQMRDNANVVSFVKKACRMEDELNDK